MNIYQQELMDHYQHPRNRGAMEHADFSSSVLNPSCGDSVCYEGTVDQGRVTDVVFSGKGCVISQATASMLSEKVKGQALQDLMLLDKQSVLSLIGIELGPTRLRCALLPLEALHKGLSSYASSLQK